MRVDLSHATKRDRDREGGKDAVLSQSENETFYVPRELRQYDPDDGKQQERRNVR